jgi:CheY-like chemotaxis protein
MPTVLVVDDSISVRKALERILVSHDLTVVAVDSAEHALQALSQSAPDLMIADVVMPGMDGFELCQTLKSDDQFNTIPVILISGIVNSAVEDQAKQVGATGVIKKPFNPTDLLPAVDQALQTKASGQDTKVTSGSQARLPDGFDSLRSALTPFIDKADIESVLMVNAQGDCLLQLGQPLDEEATVASYFKFFASAANVLAAKLDTKALNSILLEYEGKSIMLKALRGNAYIMLVLKDVSVVSLARFLLKKQLPVIEEALAVAI